MFFFSMLSSMLILKSDTGMVQFIVTNPLEYRYCYNK